MYLCIRIKKIDGSALCFNICIEKMDGSTLCFDDCVQRKWMGVHYVSMSMYRENGWECIMSPFTRTFFYTQIST